jgi:hypothetical protein
MNEKAELLCKDFELNVSSVSASVEHNEEAFLFVLQVSNDHDPMFISFAKVKWSQAISLYPGLGYLLSERNQLEVPATSIIYYQTNDTTDGCCIDFIIESLLV